jgi:hypothetical protein
VIAKKTHEFIQTANETPLLTVQKLLTHPILAVFTPTEDTRSPFKDSAAFLQASLLAGHFSPINFGERSALIQFKLTAEELAVVEYSNKKATGI